MKEYVHAREKRQQHSTGNAERNVPKTGAVLMLKGEAKYRALWKFAQLIGNVKPWSNGT